MLLGVIEAGAVPASDP